MSYNNNSLLETTCNDEQLMRQDIREAIELGLHMNLDNDLEVEIMLKAPDNDRQMKSPDNTCE